jgi:hypothetical protein
MALSPGRAYRLQAIATVDRWPDSANRLNIELQSGVPSSVIERPTVTIERGSDVGEGYLVPKAEIPATDRVLFTPSVSFVDAGGEGCIASVVGQRTLRIATFDPVALGSDQPMVAQRILELLGELDAKIPMIPPQDRRNLVHLLQATARFAALANERADLRGLDEMGFQAKLKQWFVADRYIGLRVKEAPKLGSGTTDLLLARVVRECRSRCQRPRPRS